jgi:hypothetical protein
MWNKTHIILMKMGRMFVLDCKQELNRLVTSCDIERTGIVGSESEFRGEMGFFG